MDTGIKKGRACKLVYSSNQPSSQPPPLAREHALRHQRNEGITCYTALALLTVFGGPGLAVPVYGNWGWAMTCVGALGCVALLFYLAQLDSNINLLEAERTGQAKRLGLAKRPVIKHVGKLVPHHSHAYPHHGVWHMAAIPVLSRARPDRVKHWPYRRLAH